ncbi:MAG: ROK family protein, partial [Gammaproteobacteria bacterium]
GTKIEGAVLDDAANIVSRRRVATPADDYPAICAAIVALVQALEGAQAEPATVGVGIPGSVSPSNGRVRNANTQCLNGQPLARDLARLLARPVRLENDANCLVLSEVNGGAGTAGECVFGVIIGTGTGGAVHVNGALLRGANAIAGEWGHNHVPWSVPLANSRACYCGKHDCIETYLSGAGLLRSYAAHGPARAADVETLVARAAVGERQARVSLADYREALARCLAGIVNVIDPDLIVLAGGLSNLPDIAETTARRLPALAFSDVLETRVVTARHGDSSGVRGAACLWTAAEAGSGA